MTARLCASTTTCAANVIIQVFNNALVLGRIGSGPGSLETGPLVGRIGLRYGLVPVFTF